MLTIFCLKIEDVLIGVEFISADLNPPSSFDSASMDSLKSETSMLFLQSGWSSTRIGVNLMKLVSGTYLVNLFWSLLF